MVTEQFSERNNKTDAAQSNKYQTNIIIDVGNIPSGVQGRRVDEKDEPAPLMADPLTG